MGGTDHANVDGAVRMRASSNYAALPDEVAE
jgi:hypothetical protein